MRLETDESIIAFAPGLAMRYGGDNRFTEGVAPTLNAATGDNRLAIAFAQNTRGEVRLIGGDGSTAGALAAQPGMKQTTYIAEMIGGDEL